MCDTCVRISKWYSCPSPCNIKYAHDLKLPLCKMLGSNTSWARVWREYSESRVNRVQTKTEIYSLLDSISHKSSLNKLWRRNKNISNFIVLHSTRRMLTTHQLIKWGLRSAHLINQKGLRSQNILRHFVLTQGVTTPELVRLDPYLLRAMTLSPQGVTQESSSSSVIENLMK